MGKKNRKKLRQNQTKKNNGFERTGENCCKRRTKKLAVKQVEKIEEKKGVKSPTKKTSSKKSEVKKTTKKAAVKKQQVKKQRKKQNYLFMNHGV